MFMNINFKPIFCGHSQIEFDKKFVTAMPAAVTCEY